MGSHFIPLTWPANDNSKSFLFFYPVTVLYTHGIPQFLASACLLCGLIHAQMLEEDVNALISGTLRQRTQLTAIVSKRKRPWVQRKGLGYADKILMA